MQAWEGPAGGRARELALLAAAALLAVALAGLAQGALDPSGDAAARATVGELSLADQDEGPAERVHATFAAGNLAPGDASVDRLTLIRDPPPVEPPTGVEVRLHLNVSLDERRAGLAEALVVRELAYGGHALDERARSACGTPLTLAGLAACTAERAGPLAGLEPPPREGRDLVLGVALPAEVGDRVQGGAAGFTVHATLATAPAETPAPTRPAAVDGAACAPLTVTMAPAEDSPAAPRPASLGVDLGVAPDRLLATDLAPICAGQASSGSAMIPRSPTRNT